MMGYGQAYGHGYGSGYGGMMGGGFGGLLMLLVGALFIGGIVLLVLWAVRASSPHTAGNAALAAPHSGMVGHDEAVAIARRRLASGEITPEQYTEIARTLGS